jgi:hypothetical protein
MRLSFLSLIVYVMVWMARLHAPEVSLLISVAISTLSMAFSINTLESYQAVAFTLFTIVTTGVSFLAYAIIAAKKNLETTQQGKKSFFFSNGLMEGTETIIFLCLLCIFPHYFVEACFVFGTLCLMTTALRIRMAYYHFK